MKKIIWLFNLLAASLIFSACSQTAGNTGTVYVVSTNDMHANVLNYDSGIDLALVSGLKQQYDALLFLHLIIHWEKACCLLGSQAGLLCNKLLHFHLKLIRREARRLALTCCMNKHKQQHEQKQYPFHQNIQNSNIKQSLRNNNLHTLHK